MSFDDRFDKAFNQIQKAQKFAFTVSIVMALIWIGALGLIGWAAVHFISKLW